MHYYQFHIGDYASHTRHLSLIEDLAYRRLLDFYYLHEQPIKQRDIARQIGMRDHEQDVLTVLNEFFLSTDVGFVSPRADKEIAHYHQKVEQASRAGKASAERRLNVSSTDVQPTNNHKPITNNHKPINTKEVLADCYQVAIPETERETEKRQKKLAFPKPESVTQETWDAFVQQRKAKKAQITQLVIDGIGRQAALASWTLEDALKEIVVRNWTSFDAEWVKGKKAPSHNFMRGLT